MAKTPVLCLLLASCLPLHTFAATIFNETTFGSFSSNGLNPTNITLLPGSNQILGSNGSDASSVRDYITINIPVGFILSSITLMDTPIGAKGFLGMQGGNQLTLPPSTQTAAGLLGWWHYVPADKNTDLLPRMAVPANGSGGFTPPVTSGAYTLWIQDSSTGLFNYGFDLQVQAAPEPSTWIICGAGFAALGLLRKRLV